MNCVSLRWKKLGNSVQNISPKGTPPKTQVHLPISEPHVNVNLEVSTGRISPKNLGLKNVTILLGVGVVREQLLAAALGDD